ncbi:hypothetical protein ES708_17260 [subsurface metagenome]
MELIIYILVIFLIINSCTHDKNSAVKENSNSDSLIVLARKRIYHDDGRRTYTDWIKFQTRTIHQLAGYNSPRQPAKQNKYGGRKDMRLEPTEFFHVRKIDGRWWGVDPEGCLFIHVAINSINNWTSWSGKPFIITEWYVKGEDSGLPNQSGAGWIVKTQTDRGLFYQNYTLALLESGNCVGWHWFKYQDNDPTLQGAELSNIDANKGIVNYYYEEYKPLLNLMSEINKQVYDLSAYFMGKH